MKQFEKFELSLKTFRGFISKDPEIRYNNDGKSVTTFSLPLKKSKDDEATWLNCEAWGRLSEVIAETYHKGDSITVQGYLKQEEYKDKTYVKLVVLMAM
jgi:single-strand DNA-binding protein